ncbi:MAG TPA: DUF2334 domain-containing protein [Pseudogracilibacillus sp.]|nr:DUF2334 domain-containing protein [Pseudogracilibacillus sp.]
MNYKRFAIVLLLGLFIQNYALPLQVKSAEERRIAIVYMSEYDEPTKNVYFWEATFSAFATSIQTDPVSQVDEQFIKDAHTLVFIGEREGVLPKQFRQIVDAFQGEIIAFGENVDQLHHFQSWQMKEKETLRTLEGELLVSPKEVRVMTPPKERDVVARGMSIDRDIPYISVHGRASYIASTMSDPVAQLTVTRWLSTKYHRHMPTKHEAFIRLEGIHPMTEAETVRKISAPFIKRQLPFYLSVTPVYTNRETGEQVYLQQNKTLVGVLQSLQQQGGIIIANGYEGVYRQLTHGEDPEFWDQLYKQRITSRVPKEDVAPLLTYSDFPSKTLYNEYIQGIDDEEQQYVEEKLTLAIEAFVNQKLYPLAFQAPLHAMSQNGYEVASTHFTSMFGNIQMSDQYFESTAPLMISKPLAAGGMEVYPDTLGAIQADEKESLLKVKNRLLELQTIQGSVIGGSYSVYQSPELLEALLQMIEQTSHPEWVDLRKRQQLTQTNHITIHQQLDGDLQVETDRSIFSMIIQRLKRNPFESALWLMAGIVLLFIIAFFVYVSTLRMRLRKRLFEERAHDG